MKSWVEISSVHLLENVRAIQAASGSGVEVLAVIKADAYGHGVTQVAQTLVDGGVRWLGVADLEEGTRVRAQLSEGATRLLVMVGMEPQDAPGIVLKGLTPVVWTAEHVTLMERAARAIGQRVCVHVEVETGMARQGAAPGAELAPVLERLQSTRWVECEGLMTHLCESEVAGSAITATQRERFEAAVAQVRDAGLHPKYLHMGNSSAVDEGSTLGWIKRLARSIGATPMVRPGYALYGHCLPIQPSTEAEPHLHNRLKPVLTWKTHVLDLREIAPGDTVGYGATFTANTPMRLALLPVGYADGFRRAASSGMGNGWVMLHSQRSPVVGRVSMNLIVVDVTHLPTVALGDEAILLGPGVSAEDHARWANTIGYDILCGLRARFELR